MIRPRTDADLAACVEALADVQAADRYPVDWPDDPRGWLTPGDLAAAWVAVADGAVTGHVGLARTRLEPLGITLGGAVTRLFVTPPARRGGLAAACSTRYGSPPAARWSWRCRTRAGPPSPSTSGTAGAGTPAPGPAG